jgi:Holliday junction DNA helicase RuvA
LVRAVLDNDLDTLCSVPGIGKKTAARLVIDLRSKLEMPDDDFGGVSSGSVADERADVRGALHELGYAPDEIRQALKDLPEGGSVEELLRQALKELAASGSRK